MIKRSVAVISLALMLVAMVATAAHATRAKERVECLFYQTFAERDIQDCFV